MPTPSNPKLSILPSNTQQRKQLRKQRLALTRQQRYQAAYQGIRQLSHLRHSTFTIKKARVGVFIDAFGEMPTQPLIDWAYRQGFEVYVPVVTITSRPLTFIKLTQVKLKQMRLTRHPLGMKQPIRGKKIMAKQLDVLFMPLVALDKQGNRMGMGGGFYDKTLATIKIKPLKIGWAYDFQLVNALQTNPWDIKLDVAVLPSQLLWFKRYLGHQSHKNPVQQLEVFEDWLLDDNLDTSSINEELQDITISQVMSPEKLRQLLNQADAFTLVNSEDLDSF